MFYKIVKIIYVLILFLFFLIFDMIISLVVQRLNGCNDISFIDIIQCYLLCLTMLTRFHDNTMLFVVFNNVNMFP